MRGQREIEAVYILGEVIGLLLEITITRVPSQTQAKAELLLEKMQLQEVVVNPESACGRAEGLGAAPLRNVDGRQRVDVEKHVRAAQVEHLGHALHGVVIAGHLSARRRRS